MTRTSETVEISSQSTDNIHRCQMAFPVLQHSIASLLKLRMQMSALPPCHTDNQEVETTTICLKVEEEVEDQTTTVRVMVSNNHSHLVKTISDP